MSEETKPPTIDEAEKTVEALKQQMNLGEFKPPVCPYCKTELLQFKEKTLLFKQGLIVHVFWCWNDDCRSLLSMQILPPDAPQPEQRRIQLPPGVMQ